LKLKKVNFNIRIHNYIYIYNMEFINTLSEELKICNESNKEKRKNSEKKNYLNIICNKPWGKEYFVYQNENIGIWLLHINENEKTSVHCHFKKDTILIPIKNTFRIDLYSSFKILNELEMLYIPKKTFHGLGSYKDDSVILEIEIYNDTINYTDKNDLLRLRDKYNRDKHSYEKSVVENEMVDCINFHDINELLYGDTKIKISEEIEKDKNLIFLLEGKLFKNNILVPPSIIENSNNISYLSKKYNFLTFENNFIKENKKIIYNKEHLRNLLEVNNFNNIGLTSGCFDIMHVGHVVNLKLCKKNCDTFMVCLSSDKQIKQLKGKNRPINLINDRIKMLSSFKYVDYVILYDEFDDEKELDNIINIINPYVWFKGKDYNEKDIRKKHPSLKNIMLFDIVKEKSTTNIINKIAQ
tara:strand:- start:11473 stop:12708 length:1236 start_codon:yes stop_codon:yes gene_type:complete